MSRTILQALLGIEERKLGLDEMKRVQWEIQNYLETPQGQKMIEKIGIEGVVSQQILGMRIGATVTGTEITYQDEAAAVTQGCTNQITALNTALEAFQDKKNRRIEFWDNLLKKVKDWVDGHIAANNRAIQAQEQSTNRDTNRLTAKSQEVASVVDFFENAGAPPIAE
ncbi:MAG: hypothetical protein OEM02_03745 [Desulfobulbaceae bacterium]|nr:hypothetical protein [Desulfobulbaceae bacterium]